MNDAIEDPEFGLLTWDQSLDWWEGSICLSSEEPFHLYVLARPDWSTNRAITAEARRAIERIRGLEGACREYAATQLLAMQNAEWSDGTTVSRADFVRRLTPESVEIHENGYSEVHFGDDNLFWGHAVGVRIRPSGEFQEAVVEG